MAKRGREGQGRLGILKWESSYLRPKKEGRREYSGPRRKRSREGYSAKYEGSRGAKYRLKEKQCDQEREAFGSHDDN